MTIDQSTLRRLLSYDPDTGEFVWLNPPNGKCKSRAVAGSVKADGYIAIGIQGRYYKAHRLAWLYVYGHMPSQIDHIDRDKRNNRIANLREADSRINGANRGLFESNRSGCKGVFWYARVGKWQANITINRKVHYLGRFEHLEDAVRARKEAEIRFGVAEIHRLKEELV